MDNKLSKPKTWFLKGLIASVCVLPVLVSLSSCQPISGEEIVNNLFPNLWVFITHIIAAVILIVLMIWLVWKPTKQALDKRHDFIAKQIADAQKSKEKADMDLEEANQLKVDAMSQAMTITTQAKSEAFNIVEQAKKDAKQTANEIVKNAKDDINKEKLNVRADAQNDIINIAFDVAESVLQTEIKKQDKDKYLDDLLSTIEKDLKESK